MNGNLVYPRLQNENARKLLAEIREVSPQGIHAVARLASSAHPKAAPVATGGRPATSAEIHSVRTRVLHAVGAWVEDGAVSRRQQPRFDALLGEALHDALAIVVADAAHPATWNFLTLVVMPDVAVTRFRDLADDRGLGTNRNVLRRAWTRWEILGDRLLVGTPPLGEDELVGLLERTAVARNRPLVHELASAVLNHDGVGARSEYARELYKLVRRRTGPLMLDLLSQEELSTLVEMESTKLS